MLQIADQGEDDEKLQVRIARLRTFSALPEAVTSQTVVIIEFSFCGSKLVGMERVNFIRDLGALAGSVSRFDTQTLRTQRQQQYVRENGWPRSVVSTVHSGSLSFLCMKDPCTYS